MSSNSSESKNKDSSKLNAADAKILLWVIIITVIITLLLILIFGLSPSQKADPPQTKPDMSTVITEKETLFCPFYNEYIGFWQSSPLFNTIYEYSCARVPEGFCFNYDVNDPKQVEEEEAFVDIREEHHLCPTYIRVSYPVDEEDAKKYWNKKFLGEFIMRSIYEHGEVHGYICEDDVKFFEHCEADTEGINLDELFNDCECSNGCGWTDVDAFTDLEIQKKSDHDDTWANTLWKHSENPADEIVQVSGCSLLAVVNACHMLEVEATVKGTADWTYNIARFEGNADWNKTEEMIDHYNLKKVPLFDNNDPKHFTSAPTAKDDDEKIQYVKQALASGYAVIASGKRGDDGCEENTGTCTFTNFGHYVTIVAAYEDNTFTVANAMVSRSGTNGWRMDAHDVVKYMYVAVAVGKEDARDLMECSTQGEEDPEHNIVRIQAIEDKVNVRKEMKVSQTEICGRKVHLKEIIKVENKLEPDTSGECQKGWYKVEDNKDAYWPGCYVCADFFGEYTEEECTESVKKYTNNKEVRVREQPATSGKRIAELDCGTEIEVCKTPLHDSSSSACTDGWVKITGGKYNGYYMCSNYLNSTKPGNEVCNPPGGEDPPGEDPPSPGPTSTSGKLGSQSSSGYWSSCQDTIKNIKWRIYKAGKDETICGSGCSLVAVANSAKKLGKTSGNTPQNLASWSNTRITYEQTGWTSVTKILEHAGLKQSGGWLWQNYKTSTSDKIAAIRKTLAAGNVVIAGGDRQNGNPYSEYYGLTCNGNPSLQRKGFCVFSNNGHFVTIIGITADDKLIIAGASVGKNGSSSNDGLPADAVLKPSNKAIAVTK
jgi:hypothetical protein